MNKNNKPEGNDNNQKNDVFKTFKAGVQQARIPKTGDQALRILFPDQWEKILSELPDDQEFTAIVERYDEIKEKLKALVEKKSYPSMNETAEKCMLAYERTVTAFKELYETRKRFESWQKERKKQKEVDERPEK